MPATINTRIADIREGDAFTSNGNIQWIALEDAEVHPDAITVRVQHVPDGGHGTRQWDRSSADNKLTVQRPS